MLAKLLPVLLLVTGCAHFGQICETPMVPVENAAPPPAVVAQSAPVEPVIVPTSPGGPLVVAARPAAPKTPVWKQLAIASGVVGGVGAAMIGLGAGLYVQGQNEARAADDYCRAHPMQLCFGSWGFETIPGVAVMSISAPLVVGGVVLGVLADTRYRRSKRHGN
jgi:hypothetical protein